MVCPPERVSASPRRPSSIRRDQPRMALSGGAQLVTESLEEFVLQPPAALGFDASGALTGEQSPQLLYRFIHNDAP